MPVSQESSTTQVVFRWILGLIAVGVAGLCGAVFQNSNRLTAIENSRFTATQAHQMEARIVESISDVKDAIHAVPNAGQFEKIETSIHAMELHLARRDGYVSPNEGN